MAVIALDVITCSVRIADMVSADSTNKKSESWLDFRHLMTATTYELMSIARNLLFGLAFLTIYHSTLIDYLHWRNIRDSWLNSDSVWTDIDDRVVHIWTVLGCLYMLYTVAGGGIDFLFPEFDACILLPCIELAALGLLIFTSFSESKWIYFNL